jgi:hypothetical protein
MPATIRPIKTASSSVMIAVRESGANCDPGSRGTRGGSAAPALVFLAIVTAVTTAIAGRNRQRRAGDGDGVCEIVCAGESSRPVDQRHPCDDRRVSKDRRELLATGEIVNQRQNRNPHA